MNSFIVNTWERMDGALESVAAGHGLINQHSERCSQTSRNREYQSLDLHTEGGLQLGDESGCQLLGAELLVLAAVVHNVFLLSTAAVVGEPGQPGLQLASSFLKPKKVLLV